MKPNLLLHVGTHKTGTTSIQSLLAENRGWYAERGILYPDGGTLFPKSSTPHHQFAHGLTGINHRAEQASRDYVQELKSRVAAIGAHSVIISAEPIYRHIHGYAEIQDLAIPDYWQRRETYLSLLADLLQDFNVRVLLVLRRQDQFAESLHISLCERGVGLPSFEEFLVCARSMTDYQRQLQLLEQIFRDVLVLSYHRLSSSGDLVQEFLARVGLPTRPSEMPVWLRRTPDPRLTSWMTEMTSQGHEQGTLRRFISSCDSTELLGDSKASLWQTEPRRDAFMRGFAADIEALEKRFADASGVPFFAPPTPFPSGNTALTEPQRLMINHHYEEWLQRKHEVRPGSRSS